MVRVRPPFPCAAPPRWPLLALAVLFLAKAKATTVAGDNNEETDVFLRSLPTLRDLGIPHQLDLVGSGDDDVMPGTYSASFALDMVYMSGSAYCSEGTLRCFRAIVAVDRVVPI